MSEVKTLSDLPINVYMSNDGRIHVDINSDIVFHFKGRKVEIVDDESLEYIRSSKAIVTEGTLQLNPEGQFLEDIVSTMLVNHPALDIISLNTAEHKVPEEEPIVKKTKLIRKQYIKRIRYKGRKNGRSSGNN